MSDFTFLSVPKEVHEQTMDQLVDFIVSHFHTGTLEHLEQLITMIREQMQDASCYLSVISSLEDSYHDLQMHFMKEEQVLFPYIKELQEAFNEQRPPEEFHCGSVAHPIHAMMHEHENELGRYDCLLKLFKNDVSDNHIKILDFLNNLVTGLKEHIHIENELLFSRAIKVEEQLKA